MKEKNDPKYDKLIVELAFKYKKPVSVVKAIVESPFEFAKETLDKLRLADVNTEEEFEDLKTNFNFKYLFSLYTEYRIVEHINNKKNGIKSTDS